MKYFNRIVVGVCEKDKSVDSLERKLKHQWSLNVARIKASSLINLFHKNDGGDDRDNANCGIKSQAPVQVIFLEFSCHVGVQLPFFLLTTVQAILKQVEAEPDDDFKHTILTSQPTNRNRCSAFFKNVNLIYYTEADQVKYNALYIFLLIFSIDILIIFPSPYSFSLFFILLLMVVI